jgi:hypothetical protein
MSAPFRIQRPATGAVKAAAAQGSQENFKFYLDRLMKMIPAEVISLYLIGKGFIPLDQPIVLTAWALVCVAGVLLIRAFGTADPEANKSPDWVHVTISAVAFVIWVYTLGGPFEAAKLYEPYVGSLLVLAWTFFVPIIYKGPLD